MLSLLAFIEAGLGHSLIDGDEQLAFVGVLEPSAASTRMALFAIGGRAG